MSVLRIIIAGLFFSAAAHADEWYPSKYGADDEIGALNNLSPDLVKSAAGLITTGKVYQLGVITGASTPAFGARQFQMVIIPHGDGAGGTTGEPQGTFNDDVLISHLGVGSQIDGFAHFGINHKYYNGTPIADIFDAAGVKKFATHTIPPIVTRGVMIDMTKHYDTDMLEGGVTFNQPEIEAAADAQGVTIKKGDVVLFHTGWQRLASEDPTRFLSGEPGLGAQGAEYLVSLDVVAVGADTWGVDAFPSDFPAHPILLAKNGVHILENMETKDLAADGANEFMFVLGAPRFEGAVQMVINPIAIR
jgi:kynurenine formamidase